MCVGYRCLKNALISLNIVYVVVGLILIYSSVSGKLKSPYSDYLPVSYGEQICGTFLIVLAALGIVGSVKHHQVILFFYMIILFVLFLLQVSVSYASITISDEQLRDIAFTTWNNMDDKSRNWFIKDYECCNFYLDTCSSKVIYNVNGVPLQHLDPDTRIHGLFQTFDFQLSIEGDVSDIPCTDRLIGIIGNGFRFAGRFGMFFSFTEIIGIWLTKRYRNQKDPRTHLSSAFL